jgi:outer membrane protein TolC
MSLLPWKPQWLFATINGIGALFLSALVSPVAAIRGRRHILPAFTAWISPITKTCLVLTILLAAVGGVMTWCEPAQGAETGSSAQVLTSANPLTFDESVKIAINQSPVFTKSSVEIDIRRMDETDARYAMVPPLTFRTYYYVNRPNAPNLNPKPYSLSFSTDPYNPFGTYFTLQAEKIATQMAILSHLQIISKGLERLGSFYLNLDNLKKMTACQKELINLDREILTFAENRVSIGTGTSLDTKLAQQELQLAQGELEQLEINEKRGLSTLKQFLGLPTSAPLNPDLRDSRRQVLGNFDPASTTVEQAKTRSYEIKVIDLQKQLQGYKVLMAKAKVIPNILFNTQTPDPLNAAVGNGLYVGIGLEIPVWDGFRRFRDVSRQKAVLKQVDAAKEEKENALEDKWNGGLAEIQAKGVALKIARSREELARLKARQNEVRYQSGEILLPVFLESRKQVLEAQKDTLKNSMDYDIAVLRLREISGDLGNTYVDANSWKK